ncbi:sugar transferase [Isoalcanivorax indicus]|uniref:sugar transferase n=1 Tax=Isoalcanivorax indicus TaxID=2202653 RepID=UPI000DB9CE63|nr:sugar transferase [Isoalcanivorax indicus]
MSDHVKRAFDILSCGAALLLLSLPLLAIALWIRLDSKGPALFLQNRVGKDAQLFRIYKFRTMVDRAPDQIDQHAEKVISEGDDPRITRAGRFLRATSLDELPQLINMLKGDMSIVGPRPIIPEQLEVVPPEHMDRFNVRPGLTGLAQVRGRRSLGWLEQLQADSEYVQNYGFWYDIGIILKTVVVVLKGSGVYGGEGQNWRAYRDSLRAQQARDAASKDASPNKE